MTRTARPFSTSGVVHTRRRRKETSSSRTESSYSSSTAARAAAGAAVGAELIPLVNRLQVLSQMLLQCFDVLLLVWSAGSETNLKHLRIKPQKRHHAGAQEAVAAVSGSEDIIDLPQVVVCGGQSCGTV